MAYFGSDVVWGTTEGTSFVSIANPFLAQPKVCDLDVSVSIQHDVVQLEVTINDASLVQVEETDDYLSSIESDGE